MKTQKRILSKLCSILIIVFFTQSLYSQGVVCREVTISGTKNLESKGKKLITGLTTGDSFDKMKVYITYETLAIPNSSNPSTLIYVYSNYKTLGTDYATKIFYNIDEIGLNIYDYCRNLVFHNTFYPETIELSSLLKKSIKTDISFYLDNRIFSHPELKYIDLNGAQKIYLSNSNGNLISDGYNTVILQKELKEMGFYKGKIDGLKGGKTSIAINDYKKALKLDKYNSRFTINEDLHHAKFDDSDDFLKYIEENDNILEFEICLTDNGELSVSGANDLMSIEISTSGQLKLTLTDGTNSYDFKIIEGQKVESNEGCQIERKICFSKRIKRSYTLKCGNNSIETLANGTIKLSSGNFSSTF
ncbi:hypothetical protein GM418_30715 [Maribellus comscasis]|uniref:Peptidoglycan binding-like domain-containing protein n=1 Tax=Maribellus comscasis TaxID=2681766 RepID=A0A6I6K5W0_9BACT|nr:peptidoglycan-binding domain-containing protein [Maribellus comscasis]QGY47872.1 hypothetical protein GM418_30715 [Maribellus comscasis]